MKSPISAMIIAPHTVVDAGDAKNRGIDFIHDEFDFIFDFINLGCKFLNKFDSMLLIPMILLAYLNLLRFLRHF